MIELNKKTLRRIFLGAAGCIILYWLLHETERVKAFLKVISGFTTPFVLGGVLAFILNVPMRAIETKLLKKMKREGARRIIAVILTFIAVLIVVSAVCWLLIPQVVETVKSLIPSLYNFFSEAQQFVIDKLSDNPQLMDWFVANTEIENIQWDTLIKDALAVFGNSVSAIVSGAISAIGTIYSGVFNVVIAVVFCVYCLFQKETLSRQGRKLLYAFVKEKTADTTIRILRLTNSTFSNFLSGQCLEVCILGAMFAVAMAIFRMPYIPLISVVIAVTAFIPIIGAWAGCVVGAFLIFVQDPMLAVWFVIMFVIIQQIENNLIYPRVVGTSVGLSGMWVLIAITIGGELMGILGMFLMIPAVSVLYTLIKERTNRKLETSPVDPEKFKPQPPELSSKFKEKRHDNKRKRMIRRESRKQSSGNEKKE